MNAEAEDGRIRADLNAQLAAKPVSRLDQRAGWRSTNAVTVGIPVAPTSFAAENV